MAFTKKRSKIYGKSKKYSPKKSPKKRTVKESDKEGGEWARRRLFVRPTPKGVASEVGDLLMRHYGPPVMDYAEEKIHEGIGYLTRQARRKFDKRVNPSSEASQSTDSPDPSKRWIARAEPTRTTPTLDGGVLYKKSYTISSNTVSKSMQSNMDLYKKTKYKYFDLDNAILSKFNDAGTAVYYNWCSLVSQVGYNRKGCYAPTVHYKLNSDDPLEAPSTMINSPLLPLQSLCTNALQRWGLLREVLCTPETNELMQDESLYAQSAILDLTACIARSTDRITVYSRSAYVPTNINIFVLQCIKSCSETPYQQMSGWDVNNPVGDFLRVPTQYVYDKVEGGQGPVDIPVDDRGVQFSVGSQYLSTNYVPQVSFNWSPTVKEHWIVENKFSQKLNPNDKFEFSLHQHYSQQMSYRAAQSLNPYHVDPQGDSRKNFYKNSYYTVGDRFIFIEFYGDPCNGRYLRTGAPEEDFTNYSWSYGPARIAVTASSEVEYYAQDNFNLEDGSRVDSLTQGTARIAEAATHRYAPAFNDSEHTPLIQTDTKYQSGTVKLPD